MRFVIAFILVIASFLASGQPVDSLRKMLDRTLDIMQENSLHRANINWKDFREKAYQHTAGVTQLDSLLAKYPLLFQWLGDYHGGVSKNGGRWFKWRPGKQRTFNAMLDSASNKGPFFLVQRIGDIGYLRMPSVYATNDSAIERWSQRIADSLCKLNPSTLKGWVIDLRLCPGGNVWPMLAALAPVLGDGPIGGISYIDKRAGITYFIKDGKPFGNNRYYSVPRPGCSFTSTALPVAVLTGPLTGSSGESLLLAFKSRKFTRVFGEPTAGYITSNNNYEIYKGVMLFLATCYMADGQGKIYSSNIQPDVLIQDGDDFFDFDKDQKLSAALAWLRTSGSAIK